MQYSRWMPGFFGALAAIAIWTSTAVGSQQFDAVKDDPLKLDALDDAQSKKVSDTESELRALEARYSAERNELDAIRKERSHVLMEDALAAWKKIHAIKVIEELSPAKLNAPFVAAGGSAPFADDMPAEKLLVLKPIDLCQGQSLEALEKGWFGSWFTPCASEHYEGQHILRDLAALPDSNNLEYIARLQIPAGVELILGTAGAIRSEYSARVDKFYVDAQGRPVGGGGHGGAVQLWLDAKSQGKSRASDFGLALVRMAPVPKGDDPAILQFSVDWRKSYGHPEDSRRVYAAFLSDKRKRYVDASAVLKQDFDLFDGFFRRSFSKEYPGEPPLAP